MNVSVVIPVYNAIAFLPKAMSSLLHQSILPDEIIVVNDASTDGTAQWIEAYSKQHTRIRLVNLPPKIKNERRTAMALNEGIKLAKGKYIALMDADDICLTHRIEAQLNFMEQHKLIDICGMAMQTIIEGSSKQGKRLAKPIDDHSLKLLSKVESPFYQSTIMFRCQHKTVLVYDESYEYAEDFELYNRVAPVMNMANLPQVGVYYRIHPAQSIHHPVFSSHIERILSRSYSGPERYANDYLLLHNHRTRNGLNSCIRSLRYGLISLLNPEMQRLSASIIIRAIIRKLKKCLWQWKQHVF